MYFIRVQFTYYISSIITFGYLVSNSKNPPVATISLKPTLTPIFHSYIPYNLSPPRGSLCFTSYANDLATDERLRSPALACDRIPSRALRLLVTCPGVAEERAAERRVVDASGRLCFIGEEQEGVPLVI